MAAAVESQSGGECSAECKADGSWRNADARSSGSYSVRSSGDGSRGSVNTPRNECCEAGRVRTVSQTARVPTSPSGDAVKGSLTVAVLPKHRQEVSGGIGFTWRNEDR